MHARKLNDYGPTDYLCCCYGLRSLFSLKKLFLSFYYKERGLVLGFYKCSIWSNGHNSIALVYSSPSGRQIPLDRYVLSNVLSLDDLASYHYTVMCINPGVLHIYTEETYVCHCACHSLQLWQLLVQIRQIYATCRTASFRTNRFHLNSFQSSYRWCIHSQIYGTNSELLHEPNTSSQSAEWNCPRKGKCFTSFKNTFDEALTSTHLISGSIKILIVNELAKFLMQEVYLISTFLPKFFL